MRDVEDAIPYKLNRPTQPHGKLLLHSSLSLLTSRSCPLHSMIYITASRKVTSSLNPKFEIRTPNLDFTIAID